MEPKAKFLANKLLTHAENYSDDWNYGNAIHDANLVLGIVAVVEHDIKLAKHHLNRAGKTPGSPQLNAFGPDMTLAKMLLKLDEREAVIRYLEDCKRFWKQGADRLKSWISTIKRGRFPYFESV